jgi:hypothetical protein
MSKYLNDYDRSIHSNPDAQAWAKFFIDTLAEQSWRIEHIDEGLMTGWFANAMMAMHDHVKRKWVGFTAAERDEIVPMLVQSLINHDDKTMAMLLRAILIDVEERLKEKNGYGLQVYGPPTDFISPSVVKAISKREWVGLTDHELQVLDFNDPERGKLARAVEAKLKERNK